MSLALQTKGDFEQDFPEIYNVFTVSYLPLRVNVDAAHQVYDFSVIIL